MTFIIYSKPYARVHTGTVKDGCLVLGGRQLVDQAASLTVGQTFTHSNLNYYSAIRLILIYSFTIPRKTENCR